MSEAPMTEAEEDAAIALARASAARYRARQRALMLAFVGDAVRASHGDLPAGAIEAVLDAARVWQLARVGRVAEIEDPAGRVRASAAEATRTPDDEYALAVIRWSAVHGMLDAGTTREGIATQCGLSPAEVDRIAATVPTLATEH